MPEPETTVPVLNAMSIPVCKVSITSLSDPEATYENINLFKQLLPAGAEEKLVYKAPPKKDSAEYRVVAYECDKSDGPGEQLFEKKVAIPGGRVVLR